MHSSDMLQSAEFNPISAQFSAFIGNRTKYGKPIQWIEQCTPVVGCSSLIVDDLFWKCVCIRSFILVWKIEKYISTYTSNRSEANENYEYKSEIPSVNQE